MTKSPSILIVDDTAAHRSLVRRSVKRAGIALPILEAESIAAARQILFSADNPALVLALVDLNLGDGNGTELIEAMRSSSHYLETPIIVLSTSALVHDMERSERAGANHYLTKSGDLDSFRDQVAQKVRECLGL